MCIKMLETYRCIVMNDTHKNYLSISMCIDVDVQTISYNSHV